VGWERASSFGFLALGFSVGKNQMCLTERWLFLYAAQRPYTRHMAYISALAEWRHLCIFNI
jgi:hypothetical protein